MVYVCAQYGRDDCGQCLSYPLTATLDANMLLLRVLSILCVSKVVHWVLNTISLSLVIAGRADDPTPMQQVAEFKQWALLTAAHLRPTDKFRIDRTGVWPLCVLLLSFATPRPPPSVIAAQQHPFPFFASLTPPPSQAGYKAATWAAASSRGCHRGKKRDAFPPPSPSPLPTRDPLSCATSKQQAFPCSVPLPPSLVGVLQSGHLSGGRLLAAPRRKTA